MYYCVFVLAERCDKILPLFTSSHFENKGLTWYLIAVCAYSFLMDRVSNVQASQLRHATGHVHDEAAQLSLVNLFLI